MNAWKQAANERKEHARARITVRARASTPAPVQKSRKYAVPLTITAVAFTCTLSSYLVESAPPVIQDTTAQSNSCSSFCVCYSSCFICLVFWCIFCCYFAYAYLICIGYRLYVVARHAYWKINQKKAYEIA
ncbi:hypothetical protein A0J61_04448 [Choanephora cucurbitarum]|uniref:Uncharacterized protein n=1 Tax=Choanephora cucurbitarum TaxID=101091 RepID=A0A1C7NEG4_9FUNG|nr:hypothetical protein A0J61_04448 [Choanephora cucurbitarum]